VTLAAALKGKEESLSGTNLHTGRSEEERGFSWSSSLPLRGGKYEISDRQPQEMTRRASKGGGLEPPTGKGNCQTYI